MSTNSYGNPLASVGISLSGLGLGCGKGTVVPSGIQLGPSGSLHPSAFLLERPPCPFAPLLLYAQAYFCMRREVASLRSVVDHQFAAMAQLLAGVSSELSMENIAKVMLNGMHGINSKIVDLEQKVTENDERTTARQSKYEAACDLRLQEIEKQLASVRAESKDDNVLDGKKRKVQSEGAACGSTTAGSLSSGSRSPPRVANAEMGFRSAEKNVLSFKARVLGQRVNQDEARTALNKHIADRFGEGFDSRWRFVGSKLQDDHFRIVFSDAPAGESASLHAACDLADEVRKSQYCKEAGRYEGIQVARSNGTTCEFSLWAQDDTSTRLRRTLFAVAKAEILRQAGTMDDIDKKARVESMRFVGRDSEVIDGYCKVLAVSVPYGTLQFKLAFGDDFVGLGLDKAAVECAVADRKNKWRV